MASAPEHPPNKFFGSVAIAGVSSQVVDNDYEVFGTKSLTDVVTAIRKMVSRSNYLVVDSHLDDAVSVATLSLLEYWIPRFATSDTKRNFYFAVKYGTYRAGDYLLNEGDEFLRQVPLDAGTEGDEEGLSLSDVLPDPAPSIEDIMCSDAVVADVRRLVDELDFQAALSAETTRQEARRTFSSQRTVARNRNRAKNCVRAAYLASI